MEPMNPAPHPTWQLVLPVKGTDRAKTRLTVAEGVSRPALARAMALDTLAAALACPTVRTVLVVTSDDEVASAARAAGARVEADPGQGLNAAIRRGLALTDDEPVAVLLGDLPALRPDDLAEALAACAGLGAAFVPDAEGTGTVLLTADRPADVDPAFGSGSAARHGERARRLDLDLPRLRRDVDVAEALHAAVALGVGPLTARALGQPGRPG